MQKSVRKKITVQIPVKRDILPAELAALNSLLAVHEGPYQMVYEM